MKFTDLLYPKINKKMKRIILLIALVAIAMTSMAQDIIVTRSQTRIEGRVLEISDTEVKYNKQESPNGPSLVLPTSEIVTILFSNGDVVNFHPSLDTKQTEGHQEELETTQGEPMPTWQDTIYEEFPVLLKTGKEIMYRTGTQLLVMNGKVFYGDVQLEKKEWEELLSNCEEAYQLHKLAKNQSNWTITLLSSFSLFTLWSIYQLIVNVDDPTNLGAAFWVPLSLAIVSFHFGMKSINNCIQTASSVFDTYNQSCAWRTKDSYSADLSLSASPYGIGLTLTF